MGTASANREIARRIEEISNDPVHGATFLAGEAVCALALAAETMAPGEEYFPSLNDVGQRLARARPAMAAIGNMAQRFVRLAERTGKGFDVRVLEAKLLAQMEAASEEAACRAAEYLYDGARGLTCSYSSAVLGTFNAALASGKEFRVGALESRAGELVYGQKMLEAVTKPGLATVLVPDHAIFEAVNNADMVMVGADTLLPDGGIINGCPTIELAQGAKESVPVNVVCESFKLGTGACKEAGFDLVPASLINQVITDTRAKVT